MDRGPVGNAELIWMLGYQLSPELLEGLTNAITDDYMNWVLIPDATLNARTSTVRVTNGTLVPRGE